VIATLRTIGRIETPYQSVEECPANIEPDGPMCRVVVDEKFARGLEGLSSRQAVMLLYWFDKVDRERFVQKRRGTGEERGVFALRSPHRPNPIGVAVVRIERLDGHSLEVRGLDCLDGTPLLDIKPALNTSEVNKTST